MMKILIGLAAAVLFFVLMVGIFIAVFFLIYAALFYVEFTGIVEAPYLNNFLDAQTMPLIAFNINKLKQFILCIVLLLIFSKYKNRDFSVLNKLGDYSFGIYFIHMYVIIIFKKVAENYIPEYKTNVLSFLIFWFLMIVISGLGVHLVKKITKSYSRYFIGS